VCEENKETAVAEQRNATVTCDYRTMTIKETVPSVSLDRLVQNAKSECEKFNANTANSDVMQAKANCAIQSSETSVKMAILIPDSVQITFNDEYSDGVLTETSEYFFTQNVSKRVIQNFCDQAQVNSIEYSTSGETRKTTCEDYHIVTVYTMKSTDNPLVELAPQLESYCNKVIVTGKYPI
jgi:hypothetical protein